MAAGVLGDWADKEVQMLGGSLQVSPGSGRPDTQLPDTRTGTAAFLSVSIRGGLRPIFVFMSQPSYLFSNLARVGCKLQLKFKSAAI
jgi:hypothetical protein